MIGRIERSVRKQRVKVLSRDAGELAGVARADVAIGEDAAAVFDAADVVIEFSLPDATTAHAQQNGRKHNR